MTTYEVTGTRAFLGHEPGETFEADLSTDAERRALERGSIRVVEDEQKEDGNDA